MPSVRPPFPDVLDSTILAAFRSCPRKAELEFVEHWRPQTPNVHLHAGAAYAAGLEAMRTAFYVKGTDPEEALALGTKALMSAYGDFKCPPDSAKSLERTAGALEFYASRYPLGQDTAIPLTLPGGKRGIEFNFAEPLDIIHPQTGNPLIYAGRMDMCCSYNGLSLGEDDKTASQLGASWPRQWDLRSQFTGYVWGAARAGIHLDGFLVRGVSILKTKYDTLEAITYRPDWQIERWYTQLQRDIYRFIACWNEGYYDWNLDHACVEYGGCTFARVCQMRDPQQLLEQQFERRRWDPIAREEVSLPLVWPEERAA
jgi:hypothetical protein